MTHAPKLPPEPRSTWPRKLLIAICAPVVFFVIAEIVLALGGVKISRYVGTGGVANYWIPYPEKGPVEGYNRVFPRGYKIYPEKLPLFVKDKPANGFRVFCLGESSVQGLPFEIGCFADWLRLKLTLMLPDRAVEVVNAGNNGWYAKEIRVLLNECIEQKADLLIWMVGHNEMVPQNVLAIRNEIQRPWIYTIKTELQHLRTFEFLSRALPSVTGKTRITLHDRKEADGRPCYNADELELIKNRFHNETDGAMADAKKANVPVIMMTPPKNVRQFPPSGSYFSDAVLASKELKDRWTEWYEKGAAALDQTKDYDLAIQYFSEAAKIDNSPAKLHFGLTRAHEARGNAVAAREGYIKAYTQDFCPMRAQPWASDSVREISKKHDLPLVDLELIFNNAGSLQLAGNEYITDNVHPNLTGHELIANELLGVMERKLRLPLDHTKDLPRDICRERIGINAIDQYETLKSECNANARLVIGSGNVDEQWKRAYDLTVKVLNIKKTDWEIMALQGVLEAMNGKAGVGKELIERAMSNDEYVLITYLLQYHYEPPFTRVMAAANVDIQRFEAGLSPQLKTVYKNRESRIKK
ncbi:MAG: hypothetical protein ACKVS6_08265 [Planctomycetota bacterium]